MNQSKNLLDAYMKEEISAGRHKGLSFGISFNGQTNFLNYGDSDGQPISENNYFEIASVSKIFTSLLLIKLSEDKLFTLDDYIDSLIPEFAIKNKIRILDILTHSAGMDSEPMSFTSIAPLNSFVGYNEEKLNFDVQNIRFNPEAFGKFSYSNFGYLLLGLLAKKATHEKVFANILEKHILLPLGLKNTKFKLDHQELNSLCHGHSEDLKPVMPYLDLGETFSSAGALISTTADVMKACEILMNPIGLDTIMREAIRKLFSLTRNQSNQWVSPGFHIRESEGNLVHFHFGNIAGHKCGILLSPAMQKTIAYNTNTQHHVNIVWNIFNTLKTV